ncbi:MAG: SAM-dependent methyltransferase, partial [Rhodospirillaceae bacterium]
EGVGNRVRFITGDIYETDFTEASIVTRYLAEDANRVLKPRLKKLAPGTRIVSHLFRMGDWEPDKITRVGERSVYLWVVR